MEKDQNSNFFYPPGGILIWIIIFLEVSVFFIALLVMKYYAEGDLQTYRDSAKSLSLLSGTANTIILLISGYFMAKALHWYRQQDLQKYRRSLLITMSSGGVFIVIKMIEYFDKVSHGLTISTNPFFTFYWLITAFHLLHVLIGMAILLYLYTKIDEAYSEDYPLNLEAGAAFWHMCDLIWVMIFPTLYLM